MGSFGELDGEEGIVMVGCLLCYDGLGVSWRACHEREIGARPY